MKKFLTQVWQEEDGVLTFEWVLLVTLLTIGIVSGLTAARDAIIDEMGDVAQAMLALNQSYMVDAPLVVGVHDTANPSGMSAAFGFSDAVLFEDCLRGSVPGQGAGVPVIDGTAGTNSP